MGRRGFGSRVRMLVCPFRMSWLLLLLTFFFSIEDHIYVNKIQKFSPVLKVNGLAFEPCIFMFMHRRGSPTVTFFYSATCMTMDLVNGPKNMAPVPASINRGVRLASSRENPCDSPFSRKVGISSMGCKAKVSPLRKTAMDMPKSAIQVPTTWPRRSNKY